MNKKLLLLLLVLLLPAYAHALDLPLIGGGKDDAKAGEDAAEKEKKVKTKFLIHFKSGGELETDNYTVTGDNVIVMTPSGAIYLDKNMVVSIEEVVGAEEDTLQTIDIDAAPGQAGEPMPEAKRDEPEAKPFEPVMDEGDLVERDDDGHTEEWWQDRVNKWKDKKAEAEKKYKEAQEAWAQADGALQNAQATIPTRKQVPKLDSEGKPVLDANGNPVFETVIAEEAATSEYDIIRYQDIRGSARVAMDRAQADIEEAERMLNEELPDEARAAGAPPGWVR